MFLGNWYRNPGIILRNIHELNYSAIHKLRVSGTNFFSANPGGFAPSTVIAASTRKTEDVHMP
jgi:hypothetical protein